MTKNIDNPDLKHYLVTQILSAFGIMLIIVYMIQNLPYLLNEIFRDSVQARTRLIYIVGVTPYLFCLAAYILFLSKKRKAGLVFAFLAIFRLISHIFLFVLSGNIEITRLVDFLFFLVAIAMGIILITVHKSAKIISWLLIFITTVYTIYSIIVNQQYIANLLHSIGDVKSSFLPSLIGLLNFFNIYVLIALCFCLVLFSIQRQRE